MAVLTCKLWGSHSSAARRYVVLFVNYRRFVRSYAGTDSSKKSRLLDPEIGGTMILRKVRNWSTRLNIAKDYNVTFPCTYDVSCSRRVHRLIRWKKGLLFVIFYRHFQALFWAIRTSHGHPRSLKLNCCQNDIWVNVVGRIPGIWYFIAKKEYNAFFFPLFLF